MRSIVPALSISLILLAGCSSGPTPEQIAADADAQREANRQLVERYVNQVVNNLDFTGLEGMLTEDFHMNGNANGNRDGIPALMTNAVTQWRAAMPDFHMSIDSIEPGLDIVGIQNRATGTHQNLVDQGFLAGVEPTGQTCEWRGTEFFVIRDGKLAEARITQNLMERDLCFGLVERVE